jgi:hypothetical protein
MNTKTFSNELCTIRRPVCFGLICYESDVVGTPIIRDVELVSGGLVAVQALREALGRLWKQHSITFFIIFCQTVLTVRPDISGSSYLPCSSMVVKRIVLGHSE